VVRRWAGGARRYAGAARAAGSLGRVDLAVNLLSASSLIQAAGTAGVLVMIFAETGLLVGFFLPGDSLLFVAGVLTVTKSYHLSLPVLLAATPVAAILGAQVGYLIGVKIGKPLFARPDSRLFRAEYVRRAEHYLTRFGPAKAVLLARFIPIVRTFLNPLAGVLGMPALRFLAWNVIGGLLWTEAMLLTGHFLGRRLGAAFPIDRYLLPVVGVIVVISLVPVVREIIKIRRESGAHVD
jgi:membrane-associated protein